MLVSSAYLNMTPGFTATTSDFSVEFWYKTSNPSQYAPIIGSSSFGNGALGVYIDSGGNYLQVSTNSSGSGIAYLLPTTVSADTWTYFAISRSGTTENVWMGEYTATGATESGVQTDNRNYSGTTDSIFNSGGLLGTANVTNVKVNIGATYLDPSLTTIPIPTNSLTSDAETKLLMNTLTSGSVFTDTSSTQTSITVGTGSITYQVNSPYL
jgi:hypothetical protein